MGADGRGSGWVTYLSVGKVPEQVENVVENGDGREWKIGQYQPELLGLVYR